MIDQAGILMAQGARIASERIAGVNDNMTQPHYHNYYEIYYLEKGERYQRLQDQLYLLKAGDFILFSPYIMHYSYGAPDVGFCRILLYFKREEIQSPELIQLLDSVNGPFRPDPKANRSMHRILSEILIEQNSGSDYSQEYQQSLLHLFLYQLARLKQEPEPMKEEQRKRIEDIIHYIHKHYAEPITLESLAEQFYISSFHLCREFKAHTNSTVIRYVNATRIMNAQRMFLETDKNITQISQETGFANLTHFNRVFKSVTGMTPSGYRKTHKNFEVYVGGRS